MAVLQVKRQEIKYQISLLEYKKLERNLKACMRQDEYAGTDGTYRVRSLYFDTPLEKDRMDVLRGGEKRAVKSDFAYIHRTIKRQSWS